MLLPLGRRIVLDGRRWQLHFFQCSIISSIIKVWAKQWYVKTLQRCCNHEKIAARIGGLPGIKGVKVASPTGFEPVSPA